MSQHISTTGREVDDYAINDTNIITRHAPQEYVLQVSDLPSDEKPREKLLKLGPGSLELHELLAILIGRGTRKEDVMTMSRRIVRLYGEKTIGSETNANSLAVGLDIPPTKAMQIIAAIEIGRRFHAQRDGKPIFLRTAQQAYEHFCEMAHLPKEQLRGLYLNSRRELVHEEVISVGSLTASIIHPREVFLPAVEHGAVAVIVAHNHPSGDVTPTEHDLVATRQLSQAGEVLGIKLLDHLVITQNNFKSIMEESL